MGHDFSMFQYKQNPLFRILKVHQHLFWIIYYKDWQWGKMFKHWFLGCTFCLLLFTLNAVYSEIFVMFFFNFLWQLQWSKIANNIGKFWFPCSITLQVLSNFNNNTCIIVKRQPFAVINACNEYLILKSIGYSKTKC